MFGAIIVFVLALALATWVMFQPRNVETISPPGLIVESERRQQSVAIVESTTV